MRVIGGKYRGSRLYSPKGRQTRPTSDRVRESLFGILGDLVLGVRFADLCAGTGSVGLEALSRGAWHTTFVEKARGSVALIQRNIETLNLAPSQVEVWSSDVTRLTKPPVPWDIVFIDPPYVLAENIVIRLAEREVIEDGALVILEHGQKDPIPVNGHALRMLDHRTYGQGSLTFYRKQ